MQRILAMLVAALAAGCAQELAEVSREPKLAPIGGGVYADALPMESPARARPKPSATGSIWQAGGTSLFRDPRASRPGDVLTVKIAIADRATLDSASNRSRKAKTGVGLETDFDIALPFLNTKGSGSNTTSLDGSTSTDGKGGTSRSESIDARIAAVVSDVLPNGNLLISGSQEVRVNFELRVVTVAGIVRPSDIGPDNTISYEKVAEARISYGGRGRAMEVMQPAWGQQIVDRVTPF